MTAARLSVCIPTHHGRAGMLAELLGDLAAQRHDRVCVVVVDNASRDDTAAVVARARAGGLAIAYHHHARDLGAAANVAAVVERAGEADFCWLVSSDDRLPDGAVARVLELLDAHPGVAGITVHQAVMDVGMGWVAAAQAGVTVPPLTAPALLEGADAVVGSLGWIMSGLSSQVVRRDAWLREAGALHPAQRFPHVAVMLAMAARGRPWLWCPEKLVLVRAGNVSLPVSAARWESWLLAELDAAWRGATRGPGLREVRGRYLAAVERRSRRRRPAALQGPWRDDVALLRVTTRVLWRHSGFWRRLWPRMLGRLVVRCPVAGRATPPLGPAQRRARLEATLPVTMIHADECPLAVTVRVDAPTALSSAGPHPVVLASRWRRPGGDWHQGGRAPLPRRLGPGRVAVADVCVVAPLRPGTWELQVTLVQEHVAWFADDDPGCAVTGTVEVAAGPQPGRSMSLS